MCVSVEEEVCSWQAVQLSLCFCEGSFVFVWKTADIVYRYLAITLECMHYSRVCVWRGGICVLVLRKKCAAGKCNSATEFVFL